MPYDPTVFQGTLTFLSRTEALILVEIRLQVHYAMPNNRDIDNPPLGMRGFSTYVIHHFPQLLLLPFYQKSCCIANFACGFLNLCQELRVTPIACLFLHFFSISKSLTVGINCSPAGKIWAYLLQSKHTELDNIILYGHQVYPDFDLTKITDWVRENLENADKAGHNLYFQPNEVVDLGN